VMDFVDLIEQAHLDANQERLRRGACLWDWQNKREAPMGTELCGPCKEAGFSILAHYKAIAKAMSHDGQEHPAMCWDHKKGNTPRWIREKQEGKAFPTLPKVITPSNYNTVDEMMRLSEKSAQLKARLPKPVELTPIRPEPLEDNMPTYATKSCACGCGTEFTPSGPNTRFAPGHSPTAKKEPTKPANVMRKKDRAQVPMVRIGEIGALQTLKADLLAKLAHIEAVEKMIAEGM
jgi:hypothetical protein